jgi:O-Antigen ligase
MRFHHFFLVLSRLDWLVLLLLAPILLFPERFRNIVVCLAMVILVLQWLIRYVATRRFFPSTPLNIPILCLLLTVPLSLYASANFASSLPKLTGLLFGIAVFFIVARMGASAFALPYTVIAWLLSALAIAALGLVGTEWISKFNLLNQITSRLPHLITGLTRSAQGGLHPNEVGGLLALFIPLTLSAAFAGIPSPASALTSRVSRQTRHTPAAVTKVLDTSHAAVNLPETAASPLARDDPADTSHTVRIERFIHFFYPDGRIGQLVWLFASLLLSGVLVLTQSRSALFGTAVAVTLIVAVRSPLLRRLLLIGLVIGAIVLFAIGPKALPELLFGGEAATNTAVGNLDLAGREEVWGRALYAIQDFPFTGVGLNQFEPVVNLLYPLFLIGPDAQFAHAHNLYLQAAVDFGLGGLVSYIAILCVTWLAAVRAYRTLPNRLERGLVLGLAAGLLAHQLYGLSDAITLGAKPSFEWWLFLGLIMGLYARIPAATPAKPALMRVSGLEVFLLWPLTTLIAIAYVGDNALLGVGLAVLGGCALGCAAILAPAR